jgi:hypothetical protein
MSLFVGKVTDLPVAPIYITRNIKYDVWPVGQEMNLGPLEHNYNSTSPNSVTEITRTVWSHYSLWCGCCGPQFHNPINIGTDSC